MLKEIEDLYAARFSKPDGHTTPLSHESPAFYQQPMATRRRLFNDYEVVQTTEHITSVHSALV